MRSRHLSSDVLRTNQDSLLNVSEAAEFLHLSTGTIYHLISQHRIPCIRLSSRCVRFSQSALSLWVETLTQPADNHANEHFGSSEPKQSTGKPPKTRVVNSSERSRQ
jgi:excisionase family DNA binding protein